MKKWIFIILTIFSFGIFYLLPTCKCASYNDVTQLDSVNRLENIVYNSNNFSYCFYINNSNYDYSTKRYTIQCFEKDLPNVPVNIGAFNGNISVYLSNDNPSSSGQNMSGYINGNNYAYYYSSSTTYQYLYIRSSTSRFIDLSKYVFNITLTQGTSYIGSFVPNSYYNLDNTNYSGYFNDWSIYNVMDGTTSKPNITDSTLFYNQIRLGSYVDSYFNTNNVNSYQQSIYVECSNFIVGNAPQITLTYSELTNITINGITYDYSTARSLYSWLGSNITLYNDNSSLFNFTSGDRINDVINNFSIRVADYSFKSSSYYNSSIGLRGYLENFKITCMSEGDSQAYINGYNNGYTTGENTGYSNGYNDGVASNRTGFDNLMFSIADVPIHIVSSVLNFEILGVNLLSFFMAIITLMLFIFVVRKFKE